MKTVREPTDCVTHSYLRRSGSRYVPLVNKVSGDRVWGADEGGKAQ
jgi:hypothetical protein